MVDFEKKSIMPLKIICIYVKYYWQIFIGIKKQDFSLNICKIAES